MLRPIEHIVWVDSITHAGWFSEQGVLGQLDIPLISSVGFIIDETDIWLVLSTTVGDGGCLSPVAIPVQAILERETLCEVETE